MRTKARFWGILRVTGDEQTSHDIAQETFLRAWQRFEQVSRYDQPRAWLFRVATNLASNHRRHRSIHDATMARMGANQPTVIDPAAGVAESAAVRAALLAMPVRQRSALVLRVVYGLSIPEIAEALGASRSAAAMTLSRAREASARTKNMQEETDDNRQRLMPLGHLPHNHRRLARWRASARIGAVAAHVSGWRPVRRQIAMYESLDKRCAAYRATSDGRLWRAVRAGMTSSRGRATPPDDTPYGGRAGALAAVLLLALGFAQLFQAAWQCDISPGVTATAQGTPTALPTAGPPRLRSAPPAQLAARQFPYQRDHFWRTIRRYLSFGVPRPMARPPTPVTADEPGRLAASDVPHIRPRHTLDELTQFPLPNVQTSECEVQVDTLDANRVFVSMCGTKHADIAGDKFNELTEDGGAPGRRFQTMTPIIWHCLRATSVGGRSTRLGSRRNGSRRPTPGISR